MSKGHFITFEGGDGAGKTTLIESLHKTFAARGRDVLHTRAPGSTPAGQEIRKLVLHPTDPVVPRAELLLFLADRAEQVEKIILPALSLGKVVLCDRYNDSTLAYQGIARGFSLEEVWQMCHFATNGLVPDLTIYLDIDPKTGIERVQTETNHRDFIESEGLQFHQMIREAYHSFAKNEPERFEIIDASLSKQAVLDEALRLIDVHCFAPHH